MGVAGAWEMRGAVIILKQNFRLINSEATVAYSNYL